MSETKTYECTVRYTHCEMAVKVPTETRGVREVRLDTSTAVYDKADLTSDEQHMVAWLEDEGLPNMDFKVRLDITELRRLGTIYEKLEAAAGREVKKPEPAATLAPAIPGKPVHKGSADTIMKNGTHVDPGKDGPKPPVPSPEPVVAATPATTPVSAVAEPKPAHRELPASGKTLAETLKARLQESAAQVVDKAHRKVNGKGTPSTSEYRVETLERTVREVTENEYVSLSYDIPTEKNDVVANPSGILWGHGFRMQYSVWVIPQSRLPLLEDLFALWQEHGIEYHIIEYAQSQREKIREIAILKLREEVIRAHTSLINSIDGAAKRYAEAVKKLDEAGDWTQKQDDVLANRREKHVKCVLWEANERLKAAIGAAEAFDETENVKDLFLALRNCIASEEKSLEVMVTTRRRAAINATINARLASK